MRSHSYYAGGKGFAVHSHIGGLQKEKLLNQQIHVSDVKFAVRSFVMLRLLGREGYGVYFFASYLWKDVPRCRRFSFGSLSKCVINRESTFVKSNDDGLEPCFIARLFKNDFAFFKYFFHLQRLIFFQPTEGIVIQRRLFFAGMRACDKDIRVTLFHTVQDFKRPQVFLWVF